MKKHLLIVNSLVWQWKGDVYASYSGLREGQACADVAVLVCRTSGRIVRIFPVSEEESVLQTANLNENDVEIYDGNGQLLIPGLHDVHIHVQKTGETLYYLDLRKCRSIKDVTDAVRAHSIKHPQLPWIIGVNWDQTDLGR